MSIKQQIKKRFADIEIECIQKDAIPSVIIATGVNPDKPSTFSKAIVISALPDAETILGALEDAIDTVKQQIANQKKARDN